LKYDLHSHTTCSDGRLTPEALLDRAVEKQVDVFAITDHDTVKAIPIARKYIQDKQLNIELIGGVEISTRWTSFEIHIVGLKIDENDPALIERLNSQIDYRNERAKEIGSRLEKAGIPDAYINAKRIAGDAAISRSHYAKYLIELGKAKNFAGVFKKYMKRGKIGYVPSEWVDIKTAVQWIHEAGGIAVIAHPSRYDMTTKWLKRLLVDFKKVGGDAIEVALPQQTPQEREKLGQLCLDYDLMASVGSDFHFVTNWSELGKNLYLSDKYLPVWHNW
jgi:predicted metal-dependent phosphoesterase TrpH